MKKTLYADIKKFYKQKNKKRMHRGYTHIPVFYYLLLNTVDQGLDNKYCNCYKYLINKSLNNDDCGNDCFNNKKNIYEVLGGI